jgi:hypothetical protein
MSRLKIAVLPAGACLSLSGAHAQVTTKTFNLAPEAKVLSCFAANVAKPPVAAVTVTRAGQRDHLVLHVEGLKPNLNFDVFTVQRSNLLADGTPDPAFTGSFGLAWYQSDLHADADGKATTSLNSIFIDQIFGFDPDAPVAPTNTFHIGFWFNNSRTAAPCGFDPTKPTPFNGEHNAGPAAMISVPAEHTHLGPLCLNPRASKPSGCDN